MKPAEKSDQSKDASAQAAQAPESSPTGDATKILFGAPQGQDARLLAEKARGVMAADGVLVHVALEDARAAELQDLFQFFAPDLDVVYFPAWDCLPYDRVSPHNDIVAQRIAALAHLLRWQEEKKRYPRLLLTTVNALTQKVMPQEAVKKAVLDVQAGARIDLTGLQNFFQHNGYLRTDTVREAGEYAIRGGIVDLFPPGADEPLRMDLFGDEVESIRSFDPATQRTLEKRSAIRLYPATEFFLDEESVSRFRAAYRAQFGVVRSDNPLYEAVSAGRRYNGMEHWQPLFFEEMDTLLSYVPEASLTLDYHAGQAVTERLAQITDFYQARKSLEQAGAGKKNQKQDVSLSGAIYHPLPPEQLYLDEAAWQKTAGDALSLSPFRAPENTPEKAAGDKAVAFEDAGGRKGRDFVDVRALPDGDVFAAVSAYISHHRQEGRKILIAAYSAGSRDRLQTLLGNAGFANFVDIAALPDLKKLSPQQVGLVLLTLEQGFIAPDLAVLTEQDILGDRLARRSGKRRKADNFLTEVSSLAPGDLVVHIDHGVGRFEGLETLQAAGTYHDCLKILYSGDDRLFVPVENLEVLSRFGGEDAAARLDKMGGAGWQARKAKVKKDLMAMADELLKIAAARQLQKGEALEVAAEVYQEFSARFPYQETDDQQRSIDNVIEDMRSGHPMDRLVCGDVGFGKTEVAIRAAYVAALNGVQVAVVVPTTLLARQHYQNFAARFKGTGIRVEQLSRLVSSRDAKAVKEGLTDGTVNIVIGTHALLSKNVKFAHLGLLVVDEEQRFGVKQKERLKELRANIHVLTLTATPIPRTLQMALTGVRDLSLIATPPVDRLAVRTFVLPFDPVVIRDAILREHYRGGQSFYVCPRIKDIKVIEEKLKELVPEVKVLAAHGQMNATDLEERMTAFYEGRYDLLLATNIIESGLDIPRANTMIVHRADMFGLAQLYQIRGRIGRSKVRAYAYMTYDPGKILTEQAQKRLEVLETLDTLGAGFQLASHDMDIRGAGNLLGEEQSGHIKEVGVELYQQMLEEAVAAAREGLDWSEEGGVPDKWSPQINLGTSVLIPDSYVEDLNVRMSLYRRLTDLKDKNDIEGFAAELIDRFGPLPEEVENLLQIIEIKQLCREAGVHQLDAGPKGAVIRFYKDIPPNPAGVMAWLQEKGGGVKLRPDQSIVAIRQWDKPAHRVKGARSLLKELVALPA